MNDRCPRCGCRDAMALAMGCTERSDCPMPIQRPRTQSHVALAAQTALEERIQDLKTLRTALSQIKGICAGEAQDNGWPNTLAVTMNRIRILDIADTALAVLAEASMRAAK